MLNVEHYACTSYCMQFNYYQFIYNAYKRLGTFFNISFGDLYINKCAVGFFFSFIN